MGAKQLSMEEAVLKKTNYYYMGAIVLFVFSAINLLGSILAFILFMESGAAFLTLSITTFIVAIILFKKYKKLLKANKSLEKAIAATKNFLIEREENYQFWLNNNGFKCSKQIGELLLDFTNKIWCQLYSKTLFHFSETLSVECHKTKRQQHEGSGSNNSNSLGFGHRYSKSSSYYSTRYGNRQYSSSTQDTSTYDVHIRTTRLDTPLIVFSCDTSYDLANELTSIMQLIINSPNIIFNDDHAQQIQIKSLIDNDTVVNLFMEKAMLYEIGKISKEEYESTREELLRF